VDCIAREAAALGPAAARGGRTVSVFAAGSLCTLSTKVLVDARPHRERRRLPEAAQENPKLFGRRCNAQHVAAAGRPAPPAQSRLPHHNHRGRLAQTASARRGGAESLRAATRQRRVKRPWHDTLHCACSRAPAPARSRKGPSSSTGSTPSRHGTRPPSPGRYRATAGWKQPAQMCTLLWRGGPLRCLPLALLFALLRPLQPSSTLDLWQRYKVHLP
jgi:hypothetical protein